MKVLHVLDHSLPLHSGYTFRSHNIMKQQKLRGWQPVVLTSPKHEKSWKKNTDSLEAIDSIKYYRSGPSPLSNMAFLNETVIMQILARRLFSVAKAERPDIIHAHSPILNAFPAIFVGKILNIPVVYEIRAFWEDAAADLGTYAERSIKYKIVSKLDTLACRLSGSVVVICRGLKKDLVGRGISEKKIDVVYNGINLENFKPCAPDFKLQKRWQLNEKTVFGFIGSFYHYEGLDLLLEAFSGLSSKVSDVALLLVGGGEMEKELKNQIGNLGIENKVIMPGRLPHESIPSIYSMVDAMVYPRYSMRLTELVTPLKPFESMAMGKALIASDVGGHKELIRHGETGILFESGNASSLMESMLRIVNDTGLRESLEKQGQEWVKENHSWEKTTMVHSEIYSKLIEKKEKQKESGFIWT